MTHTLTLTNGLLAEAGEAWQHLSPAVNGERRFHSGRDEKPRMRRDQKAQAPTVDTDERTCRHCRTDFVPRNAKDAYCTPTCYTKSRQSKSHTGRVR
jgi:hypothetical protein